jgi:PPOX class probable F420-dependent enzyme
MQPDSHRRTAVLPDSHVDLLDVALPAVLTTEMPDGRLQATVVWCGRDGHLVLLNTMREFQKARNLRARPRACLLVVGPPPHDRWIEVRGTVMESGADARAHLDELARHYTGRTPYFGEVVPAELEAREHPVLFRLTPAAVQTGPRFLPASPHRADPLPPDASRPSSCGGEPAIRPSHLDLLDRPLLAALATRMPNGLPQTQPVWFERAGNDILVNTTRERRKGRNLAADPRATVLILDPDDSSRWVELRCDAELTEVGAEDHLERLAHRYTGHGYYGPIYPAARRSRERRLLVRLHPRSINYDAIHRP